MCRKLITKRLLLRLTTESTFIFNVKCHIQTKFCTLEGPLSVVFSDIYIRKPEKEAILLPRKPKLYQRFVETIFTRRETNVPVQLLELFNNYHPKIKLKYEIDPEKFLGNGSTTNKEHQRVTKLTPHCSSSISKKYKRNVYLQTSTEKKNANSG